MRHTGSMYTISSFESFIVRDCIQSLRLIYDSPDTPEGIKLDNFLKQAATDWRLKDHIDRHTRELAEINRDSRNYY